MGSVFRKTFSVQCAGGQSVTGTEKRKSLTLPQKLCTRTAEHIHIPYERGLQSLQPQETWTERDERGRAGDTVEEEGRLNSGFCVCVGSHSVGQAGLELMILPQSPRAGITGMCHRT